MISRALSTSRKFSAVEVAAGPLGEFCQVLYTLMVAHSDDFGRMAGDPFTVKHAVVPASHRQESDIVIALGHLHEVGLIDWFEVDGDKFIQIKNFDAHQIGLHKRTRSQFPESSGKIPDIPSEEKGREGNRTELKGTEGKGTEPPPAARPPRPQPIVSPRRKDAAWEGPRGLYVPQRLHRDFIDLRGGVQCEPMLLAFYADTAEAWLSRPGDEPGADMFGFWKARYAEKWPTTTALKQGGNEPDWAYRVRVAKAAGTGA